MALTRINIFPCRLRLSFIAFNQSYSRETWYPKSWGESCLAIQFTAILRRFLAKYPGLRKGIGCLRDTEVMLHNNKSVPQLPSSATASRSICVTRLPKRLKSWRKKDLSRKCQIRPSGFRELSLLPVPNVPERYVSCRHKSRQSSQPQNQECYAYN